VDVWATILDYAGLEPAGAGLDPANGYSGCSLRPIVRDGGGSIRDDIFVEYNRFGRLHHQAGGFYPIRCIRTADWKLAVNLFDRDELYHVREDPWERTNRIDNPAYACMRNELHDRLLYWQEETKDVLRSPQWARRPWRSDYRYRFEGLFTTGYKDPWESGSFFD
jgi:arylsulfatase A-like enzyme